MARCRRILADVQAADDAMGASHDVPRGELRLTAPYSVGTTVLPGLLAEYLRTYPHVRIELVLSDRRLDLIEDGFDAALRVGQLPTPPCSVARSHPCAGWSAHHPPILPPAACRRRSRRLPATRASDSRHLRVDGPGAS